MASTQFAIGQCITGPPHPPTNELWTPKGIEPYWEEGIIPMHHVFSPERTDQSRADQDSSYKTRYKNAEFIYTYKGKNNPKNCYSSSFRFNCHGFAWHMAQLSEDLRDPLENLNDQLSEPVTFELGQLEGDFPYISDGSFVLVEEDELVNNWIHPAIVLCGPGHSAITTETPKIVISKWEDDGPLVKHSINESPYPIELGDPKLKFYIIHDYCNRYYSKNKLKISGPSEVDFCVNPVVKYSVDLVQTSDDIIWQYSNDFIVVEEEGNYIKLRSNNNTDNQGWVEATVNPGSNTDCASVKLDRYDVNISPYVETPVFSYEDITLENAFGSPAYYLCNSHTGNKYYIDNKYEASHFKVQICRLNGQILYQFSTSSTSGYLNYPNLNGYYLFRICGRNDCSYPYYGDWLETEIEFRDCTSGGGSGETGETGDHAKDLLFGPNPANDIITINNNSDIYNKKIKGDAIWSIEVYNEFGILVKKQVNLYGNEHTINTADLKTGIYIVIARSKNEVKRSKLFIER